MIVVVGADREEVGAADVELQGVVHVADVEDEVVNLEGRAARKSSSYVFTHE